MSSTRLYLKNLDMPSFDSLSSRGSSSRTEASPRYSVQPKYYSDRAHPCRYPVLVTNIPRHICWQELKDFGRLAGGAVAFCNLEREKNGRGFIEYLSLQDANEAIRMLNGQRLGGGTVTVSAYRTTRRTSRSRSPIRRRHYEVDARKASEERRRTSSSRYARLRESSENFPSAPDLFPYSEHPALPINLLPEMHMFSQTVQSYRTSQFRDMAVKEAPLMLPASSSFHSTESPSVLANDFLDFDAYLRLSYDRRLQRPPEDYSSQQ
ncbi:hypothetical protein C8F04DRAFT_9050 [Mycena alexandri]|uniref:RRM domain-containing protein n=1 Tax=Mycena alexandri TaxID=1745969 RepID=A0AAD6XGQ3_9AGAR|nr:hypothetical protein C8F04DRAFT_9050 [Mycena alexandri]